MTVQNPVSVNAFLLNPNQSSVIADTATHVASNIDKLQALQTKISSITLSDQTPLLLITASQYTKDTQVIAKISNNGNWLALTGVTAAKVATTLQSPHIASLAVTDSSANIVKNLSSLQTNAQQISGITLSDAGATLTLSPAQQIDSVLNLITSNFKLANVAAGNAAGFLNNSHVQSLTISDALSNVLNDANVNAWQSKLAKITGISLTDSGIPNQSLTLTEYNNDKTLLPKISSNYTLTLTGVPIAPSTQLTALFANPHISSLSLVGSTANLNTNLTLLEGHSSKIGGITLSDTPAFKLTTAQLAAEIGVLAKITNPYTLTLTTGATVTAANLPLIASHLTAGVTVLDSSVNIVKYLTGLQANAAQISGITLSDAGATLTLSPAQQADSVLNLITSNFKLANVAAGNAAGFLNNNHVQSLTIADALSNVLNDANVSAWQSKLAKITGISLTDKGIPNLSLTLTEYNNDKTLLPKISSNYTLALTGVPILPAAQLTALFANTHISSLGLTDSSVNLNSNLTLLESHVSKIGSIILNDGSQPTFSFSYSSYTAAFGVLSKIASSSPFAVTVNGVTAANVSTLLGGNNHVTASITAITVSDTLANVTNSANMANLLKYQAQVGSIVLTNPAVPVPTLTLTASQLTTDIGILTKISSAYHLTVTGSVPAADVNAGIISHLTGSLAVADSLANVFTHLDALQTNLAKISGITLTDTGVPNQTLGWTQYSNDTNALNKISSAYTLSLSGVPAGQVTSALTHNQVTSVAVSDTGINIQNNLDTLQSNLAKITGITLLDATPPTLILNETQLNADSAAVNLIAGNYNLTVNGVAAADVANLLSHYSHISSLNITDSAADVLAKLDLLQSDLSHIHSITLTDSSKPTVSLSAAQQSADAGVLALIGNQINLNAASTVSAADFSSAANGNPTQSFLVADSLQQVQANLSGLESHAGQLGSITLTDATLPTLSLTEAQYNANIDALAGISSPYNLNITNPAGIAPEKIPLFTLRAPQGATGEITLTVTGSIDGGPSVNLGSVTVNGGTPAEFWPYNLSPQPGDSWSLSVAATDANGHALGAGQIEPTPGTAGQLVNNPYASILNMKFLAVSATGVVSGLPATYSANDHTLYVLEGENAAGKKAPLSLAELTTALQNYPVLSQYLQAGQVVANKVAGTVSPDGNNLGSAPITIGNSHIPVVGGSTVDGSAALLINAPNLTNSVNVVMWLAYDTNNSFLPNPQALTLSPTQPLGGGFSYLQASGLIGQNVNLGAGTYIVFFTDDSGNGQPGQAVPGLQVSISTPAGGQPTQWVAAPASSTGNGITLEVGSVQQVEAYAATNPAGTTWYLIKDTAANIQNAGSGLHHLIAGNQLYGAIVTDGISSFGNNNTSAMVIPGSQDYIRVLPSVGDNTVSHQPYSVLALNSVDAEGVPFQDGVSHTVQFFDNGQPLGTTQTLTTDGSSTLSVQLPMALANTSNSVNHILTAKLDGNPIKIGVVPVGGGEPTGYAANLHAWVGGASQLPSTLSAIVPDTLYVIQDSAQNLETFSTGFVETGVALALAASGNLAFNVTGSSGNQLSFLQEQLIDGSYNQLHAPNLSPLTLADTLYSLNNQTITQLVSTQGTGVSLSVQDNFAHFAQFPDFSAASQTAPFSQGLINAVNQGRFEFTDTLANTVQAASNTALINQYKALGIISNSGILVTDTLADYQAQFANDTPALHTLANSITTPGSVSVEVTDTLANLQAAVISSNQQSFLQTNTAQVNLVDSVANLETAYASGSLTTLANSIKTLTGHTMTLTASDSVADLSALLNSVSENGLYTQLQSLTVLDTAQNIQTAIQGGNGDTLNPVTVANNIVMTDSYANVLAVSQTDPSLLAEVSKINLTAAPSVGSAPLQLRLGNGSGNSGLSTALPEVILSYMTGALTARETTDNSNGTLVTITDSNNQSVAIDLQGVTDASGTAFTQGGWYHTVTAGDMVTAAPVVTASSYDASSGILTLTGNNLTATQSDYKVTDFTLLGDGGNSYTLTGGNVINGVLNGNSVTIQLSASDQLAVDALLNKNGNQAFDGAHFYNLSAASGWDNGAAAFSSQSITVSNVSAPALSAVSYNSATGVFTFTGGSLVNPAGGINLADLKISGGGSNYVFNSADQISNLTTTGFTITLSSGDKTTVNNIAKAAGTQLGFAATANWDGDSSSATGSLPVFTLNPNMAISSQAFLANLTTLQSNANQISSITFTDSTTPTLTLTPAQYNANIDALSEISSPYKLVITNPDNTVAPDSIPPFTVRAPAGSSGPVTLTVTLAVSGAQNYTETVSFGSNGTTPVQFTPNNLHPKAGEVWTTTVTAANATGTSLGAGQVETTPGFFGTNINSGYASSGTVKFVTLATLPSYSATDKSFYIVRGATTKAISLSDLTAADTSSSNLHKYLQAGQIAVYGITTEVQPDGNNTASLPVVVNGDTIPVLNSPLDGGQYAITANLPNIGANQTVDMWLSKDNGAQLASSQILSTSQPYAGFSPIDFYYTSVGGNNGLVTSGTYNLFFTGSSNGGTPGNAIPGLQLAVASPNGGPLSSWISAPSTAATAIHLEVGTVSQIENYAANHTSGVTWYLLEDSTKSIMSAGTGLNSLINNHSLIGAYVNDGIAPEGNGYASISWPSAIQIGSSPEYVRVFGNYTGNAQTHSNMALQATFAQNSTHSVQLFDNGVAIGNPQTLTADGSSALALALPTGVSLANGNHVLSAIVDGSSVNIGVEPVGGGLPGSFTSALNVWVGSLNQLPASLSGITSNTLYVVQDSAQNLAAMSLSSIVSGVTTKLAANGKLAFEVTGGDLSSYQLQQIENNYGNVSLVNFSALTINDTLSGMQHVPVLGANDKLVVHDDIAHLLYATKYIEQSYPTSWGNSGNNPLTNAFSNGNVVLTDNLQSLTDPNNQSALENSSMLTNDGISSFSGIVVKDTLTAYAGLNSTVTSSLHNLAASLNTSLNYEVTGTIADLQQSNGAKLTSFLQAHDANASSNVVNVNDTVANLEAAYNHGASNNALSSLTTQVSSITGHGINLSVQDNLANLSGLFTDITETGLSAQLRNVNVVDTAQNISSNLSYGNNGNGLNPLSVAHNIVINDSYANILTASESNAFLLAEVSKIEITSAPAQGSNALQIQNLTSYNYYYGNLAPALPEVKLAFMSGALTATEGNDGNGGTMVTISEVSNPTVSVRIDLVGVNDPTMTPNSTGAYTQGGWYHI